MSKVTLLLAILMSLPMISHAQSGEGHNNTRKRVNSVGGLQAPTAEAIKQQELKEKDAAALEKELSCHSKLVQATEKKNEFRETMTRDSLQMIKQLKDQKDGMIPSAMIAVEACSQIPGQVGQNALDKGHQLYPNMISGRAQNPSLGYPTAMPEPMNPYGPGTAH